MASGSISAQLAKLAKDNPPYTKDEEEKVTNAYFFDDHDKWRELIVLHNIRFCFAFSKKFFSRTADNDDIIMMAVEGMLKAADKFDPTKGYRFASFSSWQILKSFSSILNTDLTDVKTNAITSSVLDNHVSGKDGREGASLIDFIEHMRSPDSIQADPSAHYVAEFGDRDFNDLLNHMCGLILRASSRSQRMHKDRMDNVLNAFRMKFGCSGYGEKGLSDEEIAERLGVSIWSVREYIKEARSHLNRAFEIGVSGTDEYSSYNCIRKIFRRYAIRPDANREHKKSVKISIRRDGCVRTDGITMSRGHIRSSTQHVTMLLEGSEVKTTRRSRKGLKMYCRGMSQQAPTPWMEFPKYPDSPGPVKHITKRTRNLPEICSSCVHNPACSSWLGGCEFCENKVYRSKFK